MITFREYITENKAGSATVFEQYIVEAWNTLLADKEAQDRFTSKEFAGDDHQKYANIAFKIARQMRQTLGTDAKMIHSGSDVVAISKEYIAYGGVDKTPKADIRTADNKFRLSLKENKSAQLLSGGKTDAYPVFKIAENNYGQTSQAQVKIERIFNDILERIVPPKNAGDYIDVKHMTGTKDGKVGMLDAFKDKKVYNRLPKEVQEFLNKIMLVDTQMKQGLTGELNKMFNEDNMFKQYFVYEAASGAGKFVDKTAVANSFLVFSSADGKSVVEVFENEKSPVIVDLSKNLSFRLRWKHGSKVVLAGDIKAKKLYEGNTYQKFLQEEISSFMNNNMIQEGIMDFFHAVTNWLRGFIKKVIMKIRELLKKGLNAVYDFFEISIEDVVVSGI